MTVELFHDQSPRKYGTRHWSNSQPLDLQSDSHLLSDMLPTALRGPVFASKYNDAFQFLIFVLTHLSWIEFPSIINWISPFKELFGGSFHIYSNFDRSFCKQSVETLIRMWHPIWVCTVCLCPTKRTLRQLYGLNKIAFAIAKNYAFSCTFWQFIMLYFCCTIVVLMTENIA